MQQTKKWIAVAACLAPCLANANLIQNGSFELGSYNNSDPDPRPEIMLVAAGMTNITGWTIQGPGGVHWIQGADQASAGSYSLDLQGLLSNPRSSVSTTFATTAGQQYQLTFNTFAGLSQNTGTVSVGTLQGQALLGPLKPPGVPPVYGSFSYLFLATTGTSTLTFRAVGTDGYGPVIDNVAVVAVPEVGTGVLLLVGIAAIAGIARRREA